MAKTGTWKTLIEDNLVGRVTLFFERVIGDSMTSHPMRHFTQAEAKRRFNICASIFEKLRGDLKWGIDRIEQQTTSSNLHSTCKAVRRTEGPRT